MKHLHDIQVLVYVTGIVIYNQSICDAIIRAQDVMHRSPKLDVRVNKRKEFEYGEGRLHGEKVQKEGNKGRSKSEAYQVRKQVCVGHIYA
jgi:hypothetical protein